MSTVGIVVLGTLGAERGGVPLRIRTLQQRLLVARLALADSPVERNDLAATLWPEAERENAMAYLRRAVMELRRVGFEIETPGTRLALAPRSFASDLDDLFGAIQGAFTLLPRAEPLGGVDHPAADEMRTAIRERLQERQRHLAAPPPVEPKGVPDLIRWMWDEIVRERPEVVSDLIAKRAMTLSAEFPSAPLIELCGQVLGANPPLDEARVTVNQLAGRSAHIVTRYSLAERRYRDAISDAEALGKPGLAVRPLSTLAFLHMERRQWEDARATGERAVEAAELTGDPAALDAAHTNFAGILWHLLELDASAHHYLRAIEIAPEASRIVPVANLAYLWGVFGVDPRMTFHSDLTAPTDGYRGVADAYLAFACGMGDHDAATLSASVARLMELSAKPNMERLFAVSLDCAAMALARQGRSAEAAACVRAGSRVRRDLGHARSRGERLAIRRNVGVPLFAPRVAAALAGLRSDDPERLGAAAAKLLEPVR